MIVHMYVVCHFFILLYYDSSTTIYYYSEMRSKSRQEVQFGCCFSVVAYISYSATTMFVHIVTYVHVISLYCKSLFFWISDNWKKYFWRQIYFSQAYFHWLAHFLIAKCVAMRRDCYEKPHVSNKRISVLRQFVGLLGRFVTVWQYPPVCVHTHTQLL